MSQEMYTKREQWGCYVESLSPVVLLKVLQKATTWLIKWLLNECYDFIPCKFLLGFLLFNLSHNAAMFVNLLKPIECCFTLSCMYPYQLNQFYWASFLEFLSINRSIQCALPATHAWYLFSEAFFREGACSSSRPWGPLWWYVLLGFRGVWAQSLLLTALLCSSAPSCSPCLSTGAHLNT